MSMPDQETGILIPRYLSSKSLSQGSMVKEFSVQRLVIPFKTAVHILL
jgi:hypothetical protein